MIECRLTLVAFVGFLLTIKNLVCVREGGVFTYYVSSNVSSQLKWLLTMVALLSFLDFSPLC